MSQADAPPTGWYPDPLSEAGLRWWDGNFWTQETASNNGRDSSARVTSLEEDSRAHATATADTAQQAQTQHVDSPQSSHRSYWMSVARILHAAQTAEAPIPIEIKLPGLPNITVDSRAHTFTWDLDLARLPESPEGVGISVELLDAGAQRPPLHNGRDLDVLIWRICELAFPETVAPWLNENDSFRLNRWPNVMEIGLDDEQILALSALSVEALYLSTLTAFSGRHPQFGYSLINALGLMDALDVVSGGSAARRSAPAHDESVELTSIVGRLRSEGSDRIHIVACAGPMGSGKTTAVRSLSEIEVISTEATNFDRETADKETTTVGIDYGELQLGAHGVARLYGLPGQRKFSFIWSMLEERANGLMLLLNADSDDPVASVREYLHAFNKLASRGSVAIGITRGDLRATSVVTQVNNAVQEVFPQRLVPVFTVDAREPTQMKQMLSVLITDMELRSMTREGALE